MMALSCVYMVVNLTMGHDGLVMCVPGRQPDYGHDGLVMCVPGS